LAALSSEDLNHWTATRHEEISGLCETVAAIAHGQSVPAAPIVSAEPPAPAIVVESSKAPSSPQPAPPPADDAAPAESVVRVTAQSLNRLMSLAGESLVQARWLQPFATSLYRLKKYQDQLVAQLTASADGPTARSLDFNEL
jgi:two-component system sensor histidine kinase and response regulator WspE